EMAARQIISAGERHKGDLLLLPQRINRVPQYRVQSPVRIQRDRAVRVGCVGARDRQGGARLVVEIAGVRHQQVVAVVAAAQEYQQEARRVRRRGKQVAAEGQRRQRHGGAGGGKQEFSAVHGAYLVGRMLLPVSGN